MKEVLQTEFVGVRFDPQTKKALETYCESVGKSKSQVIKEAVRAIIRKEQHKNE